MAAARGGADVFLPPAQSGGGSPGGPGGAKIMGLERNTFLIVVVVAGVAAYLLYRHFKNSSSSSAAAAPAPDTTTPTPAGTPDNSGGGGATGPNPVGTPTDVTPFEDIISQLIGAITTPNTSGNPGGLTVNILPGPGGPSATKTATAPADQTTVPITATPIAPDPYSNVPGASGGLEPTSSVGADIGFGITPGGDNGPPPVTAPAVSPGVAVGSPGAATASSPGKTVGGYTSGSGKSLGPGAIKT